MPRRRECAYCGRAATTSDHIPPKAIFPQPVPNDVELVTVPACERCHNDDTSKDDKYFATILSSSLNAQRNPHGRSVWKRLSEGGKRHPEERGFWRGILANMSIREIRSPGGIILGDLPAHTNYEARFYAVLERIVKAFFFKLRGRRLPADHAVVLFESPTEAFWEENSSLKEALASNGCFQPMEGVFRLWSTADRDRPNVTVWYMIFLEAIDFLCRTVPESEWGPDPVYLQPPARN